MNIVQSGIGEIRFEDEEVYIFPTGIPGFEDLKRWLVRASGESGFSWLLAVELPEIAFVLWHVQEFIADYEVVGYPLTPEHQVFSILTMQRTTEGLTVTANLLAPVILEPKTHTGVQFVMNDSGYSTRTPLLQRGEE